MKKNLAVLTGMLCFCGILSPVFSQEGYSSREGQYYKNLVSNLIQQVKNMQDDNARLADSVRDQGRRINLLEESLRRSAGGNDSLIKRLAAENEEYKGRIRSLENQNAALEAQMKKLERLIRDVGNAAAAPAPRERASGRKSTPAPSVDCVEHIVEKGQILTHIARAYKVSVQEIKQINHLKSDRLYVGQKLLIPVPSSSGKR